MLREIGAVHQIPGEARRRWFQDEAMDLFVWVGENAEMTGFQLAYDKPHAEKAVTWKAASGFQHTRVDDGARPGRYPASPLLVADGAFDAATIRQRFNERAAQIDPAVAAFVAARLGEFREPPQVAPGAPSEAARGGRAPHSTSQQKGNSMPDTEQGFSTTTVVVHWIIAIAIIGMLIFGSHIADLPRGPHKAELIRLHKSIGVLILVVAGYRFLRRIAMGFPPEVAGARYKDYEKATAKFVQWVLLLGAVLMPIAGMTGSLGGGHPVEIFKLFAIPAPAHKIPLLAKAGLLVHATIGYILMVAVTLHVLGALKHHLLDHDNTLRRMLGRRSQ